MDSLPNATTARTQLRQTLKSWAAELSKNLGTNLVAIIHFGSTAKNLIKIETDVDLLVIFENLPPDKWQRFKFIEPYETELEKKLKNLEGHLLMPSVMTWTEESFKKLHPLYIDFVDTSEIIYDPKGLAAQVIEKTARWLKKKGAKKIQIGGLWYWDVNPERKPEFLWSFDEDDGY